MPMVVQVLLKVGQNWFVALLEWPSVNMVRMSKKRPPRSFQSIRLDVDVVDGLAFELISP